jgi:serine-type D-Ala-D-Ala carboxypeptidase/endopeptidase (penicillin-binding protein 4)
MQILIENLFLFFLFTRSCTYYLLLITYYFMRFFTTFSLLFLSLILQAQGNAKLKTTVAALAADPQLKYASISFYAVDINKNSVEAELNPDMALIPASSMKVITTSTALGVLGGDYQFRTLLQMDGAIENGVLRGNIYIKGGGDPCLGSPIMASVPNTESLMNTWVAAIRKAGISRIEGSIIGDDSYFDSNIVPYTWQWGDMGNYYGAGVHGLNINDNMYSLFFQQQNKEGALSSVKRIVPAMPYLKITNEVTFGAKGTGDNAYIFASPYSTEITTRGTIPVGNGEFRVRGAIPSPPYYAAFALETALKNSGIAVSQSPKVVTTANDAGRQTFHTYLSPPLLDIVKHTNEESRNMYCEAFVKAIGLKAKNSPSMDKGLAAITEFWIRRGVDMNGFFISDGSGLSARNNISARTFTQIMSKTYSDTKTFCNFYDQLAIAGETGTLANIGRKSAAANNIRAKSGSINRVRSYTGYATTRSGRIIAFCIIVNNYSCSGGAMRQKLEELMIQIAQLD